MHFKKTKPKKREVKIAQEEEKEEKQQDMK